MQGTAAIQTVATQVGDARQGEAPKAAEIGSNAPFDQLKRRINDLPAKSRLGLLAGATLAVAVVVASLIWLSTPNYKVLFSNINDKDGGEITQLLTKMGVPYKFSAGGTSILVPEEKVHDTRLALASEGLPKESVTGFETMDSQPLGVTQFQEQVNYQRGLEGELARSIQSIQAVESARVHLAMPKPSIFVRDEEKPSASVVVTLRRGKSLSQSQIDGIVHLVSSSLPNLNPKAVSIVDQTGSLLTKNEEGSLTGLTTTQLGLQKQRERSYEEAILSILSPLFGKENVKATVSADMDFSAVERKLEVYKPNSEGTAAIRSSQKSMVKDGSTDNPSGIPGLLANTPPDGAEALIGGNPRDLAQNGSAANSGEEKRSDEVTNYEVDKETVFRKEQVGVVGRVNAGVVINYKTLIADGEAREVPLTPAEMEEVNKLVKQAIGFNAERGDELNVVNQLFNKEVAPEEGFWAQQSTVDLLKSVGTPLGVALIVGVLVLGLIRPLLKPLMGQDPKDGPELLPNTSVGSPLLSSSIGGDEDDESFYESPVDREARRLEKDREERLEMVRRLAAENPEVVASVVKSWIAGQTLLAPTAGAPVNSQQPKLQG